MRLVGELRSGLAGVRRSSSSSNRCSTRSGLGCHGNLASSGARVGGARSLRGGEEGLLVAAIAAITVAAQGIRARTEGARPGREGFLKREKRREGLVEELRL